MARLEAGVVARSEASAASAALGANLTAVLLRNLTAALVERHRELGDDMEDGFREFFGNFSSSVKDDHDRYDGYGSSWSFKHT